MSRRYYTHARDGFMDGTVFLSMDDQGVISAHSLTKVDVTPLTCAELSRQVRGHNWIEISLEEATLRLEAKRKLKAAADTSRCDTPLTQADSW